MSVTPSFKSNPSLLRVSGLVLGLLLAADHPHAQGPLPSAVGSQAVMDAEAQRRLQETAREAQRQRRIGEQIAILARALDPAALACPSGPGLTRQALAALVRLREDGIPPDQAIPRATRTAGLDPTQTAKPASYLRNLFTQQSSQITPSLLEKLAAGEDPAPDLLLPPFVP